VPIAPQDHAASISIVLMSMVTDRPHPLGLASLENRPALHETLYSHAIHPLILVFDLSLEAL
jgi:hypothetical protein